MKELLFYFDFSSPFAYLGATQIEDVAARNGAVVRYRPFFLGGLFREIGTADVPLFKMPEAKRRHSFLDMGRWADHYGVPLRFPSRFPFVTVKPLRALFTIPEEQRKSIVLPLFRAAWAEDRDISDDATLRQILTDAGFDADATLQSITTDAIKTGLKNATSQAKELGICGAPSFLVGDLLFWGQDRLLFVEKALNGWRPREQQSA